MKSTKTTTAAATQPKARKAEQSRKAPLLAKRAAAPAVSLAQPPAAHAGRKGLVEALAAAELPQAINLLIEAGKIKLDVSVMTPAVMLSELGKVGTGMAATPVYAGLPELADVQGARTSLSTQLANIANLETLLREARLTLGQWVPACGAVLNRAAIACENADSDPATLVSGGWTLRKGRGPAQDMPPPSGLKLKQTAFAGQGVARWKAVPNARYYEVQVDPVPGAPLTLAQSVTLTSTRVDVALPQVAPGSMVTICVRAVGAKGAGPFCDGLVARVN